MKERIDIIFSNIKSCNVFADVGCDHGFVTKKMLDSGKCNIAYIADVSEKCLNKAKNLLHDYICDGKCFAYVSDGFAQVPLCDLGLIAGMGGEEIINILKNSPYTVRDLVLQPMKNDNLVRSFLVSNNYRIEKDFMFKVRHKYYNLICATVGKESLSDDEIEFGKDNINSRNEVFTEWVRKEIDKIKKLSENGLLSEKDRSKFSDRLKRLEKYADNQ